MADISRLYDFMPGTLIKSSEVDAEFNQLIARINDLEPDSLQNAVAEKLGLSQTGTVRRGKSIIAAEESTSSTSYTTLTQPDRVQNVELPTDGLIAVAYNA